MKKVLILTINMWAFFAVAQSYNNGGLSTGSTSKSGVVAPTGYTWSELQNNTGNTTESNTTAGVSGTYISSTNNYYLADDFTIPPGSHWQISTIDFFAYQTGYTGTTSPFNTVRVNIFNGDPSLASSISIFGNDATNRFSSSEDAKMYRIFNSLIPSPGIEPVANRKIWKVSANIGTTLSPGTYWLKFQLQNSTLASSFIPTVTISGSRGLSSFNAKQLDVSNGLWKPVVDNGEYLNVYKVDFPFVINFTNSMGVDEKMQYDNRVQVYPNPVKDVFRINNPEKFKISEIEISDTSGRVVKTLKANNDYNISDLSKGIYILKIKNDGITKISKLIKE